LGVVDHLVAAPPGWNWHEGDTLVLVGARHASGEQSFPLAGSRWATHRGRRRGQISEIDQLALPSTIDFVTGEVAAICAGQPSDVTAVHDVSGGGLAAALAEMASVAGVGASVKELEGHGELFSEFPGRFVVATSDVDAFAARVHASRVPMAELGYATGDRLVIGSTIDLRLGEITSKRRDALEDALAAAL
jgi:phosphoribosylformylglycinamidine synthase